MILRVSPTNYGILQRVGLFMYSNRRGTIPTGIHGNLTLLTTWTNILIPLFLTPITLLILLTTPTILLVYRYVGTGNRMLTTTPMFLFPGMTLLRLTILLRQCTTNIYFLFYTRRHREGGKCADSPGHPPQALWGTIRPTVGWVMWELPPTTNALQRRPTSFVLLHYHRDPQRPFTENFLYCFFHLHYPLYTVRPSFA